VESSADGVVAWDVAPTDTTFGRLCAYALVGTLGGFAFLAAAVVALAVVTAVASADPGTLVVVLVLVGGSFSVLALVPFLDPEQRPDDLHPLGIAASALLGAAGIAAIAATSPTQGADVLYFVASLPALFGVLLLALAARRQA